MIRSLGIVGFGRFGAFLESLIKKLMPMLEVRITAADVEPDGKRFFTLADTAHCDVVVMAVPLKDFERTLVKLLFFVQKDAVIIDTEAAKTYTSEILKRVAAGRQYLSIQPMFGPTSYEKQDDIEGRRLIVTEHTLPGVIYIGILAFLRQWGIKTVGMTPESHDEYVARSLFCTHFPQQAEDDGLAVAEHDAIYFGDLVDGAEAYRLNPFCEVMRERLNISEEEVQNLLKI